MLKRKGFSMIELLFVMIILAAISAIAINSNKGSDEAAILTSLKSDIKNNLNNLTALKSKFADNFYSSRPTAWELYN